MKPIVEGQTGPAVEDVQQRLVSLGYPITQDELDETSFGPATRVAVRSFRSQQGLPMGDDVDDRTWIELVDETYTLGDRTLYLRLPYFKGADVKHLQMTLNVLGFSCGQVDGLYGPHTEAAVREFQSNVGLMADGMAFQDTFDAIERLHHVWSGKTASREFSVPHSGLVRAVDVLEGSRVVVSATDPIARSVASRIWNVAYATTPDANVALVDNLGQADEKELAQADIVLVVATAPLEPAADVPAGTVDLVAEQGPDLAQRLTTAVVGAQARPCWLRVELSGLNSYDGSVTNREVQVAAIRLLDGLCAALDAAR